MKKLGFIVIAISVLITGCLNSNSGNSGNLNPSGDLQSNAKFSEQIPVNNLSTVYADNGLILIGGNNNLYQGIIRYSNNIVNWNPSLLYPYGFPKTINSIASDNRGNIVAVGLYGDVYRSTDQGLSWVAANLEIQCTSDKQRPCNLFGIAVYKDMFVAVGDFGTIITSIDGGKNWKQIKVNIEEGLQSIVVGLNGTFVAVGLHGTVVTSKDGVHWNDHSIVGSVSLRGIAVNGSGTYVAVGDSATYLSTDNGAVWWQTQRLPNIILRGVAANKNGRFVAVGDQGIIYVSEDGDSWNRYISDLGGTNLYGITYSKSHKLFIAVGGNGMIVYSKDGTSWFDNTRSMAELTDFSIGGVHGDINGHNIEVTFTSCSGLDIKNLKAIFTLNGSYVTVNGKEQVSGQTSNNFLYPVTYTVYAANGAAQSYTVTVKGPPDFSKFALDEYTGTINKDGRITVDVGSNTDVTKLTAAFTTCGANDTIVKIGGVVQSSGQTTNDFSHDNTYTVTNSRGTNDYHIVVNSPLPAGMENNNFIIDSLYGGIYSIELQYLYTFASVGTDYDMWFNKNQRYDVKNKPGLFDYLGVTYRAGRKLLEPAVGLQFKIFTKNIYITGNATNLTGYDNLYFFIAANLYINGSRVIQPLYIGVGKTRLFGDTGMWFGIPTDLYHDSSCIVVETEDKQHYSIEDEKFGTHINIERESQASCEM